MSCSVKIAGATRTGELNVKNALWLALGMVAAFCTSARGEEIPPIARRLPPPGLEIPEQARAELTKRLNELKRRLDAQAAHPLAPDAECLLKAVEFAIAHGEFYKKQDVAAAAELLDLAEKRLAELPSAASWTTAKGLVVRGFRSRIDGSPQPYGLVIPGDLDLAGDRRIPLYVWLHGRGDNQTDLHFIRQRQTQIGQIAPEGAIVLHPFGRHCIGFKSAGEIDVLEAVEHVKANYPIDPDRIVLIGFSMGGAGAWHLGAHYADRWCAVSPGAGFAETARYQNLRPENYPPPYEQLLWGVYDVPAYVRNLFNLPVVAYSGELDKQIQAARVMEEAYRGEGRELAHIVGPGMGHKYHPDSLQEILAVLKSAADQGRDRSPEEVHLQTRTLRYCRMHWVEAIRLEEHWRDARIDAEFHGAANLTITTRNVAALRLHDHWKDHPAATVAIDGQTLGQPLAAAESSVLAKRDGRWSWRNIAEQQGELAKTPGLQGPIDDVFLEPFLVVAPEEASPHPLVERWVEFESTRSRDRWRALFRGEVRWKSAAEVTPEDFEQYHVILWGDPDSNRWIRRIHEKLPLRWEGNSIVAGKNRFDAAGHVPALIYPNPLNPEKYVVLNSGPTFREDHDRTNSLQNPKVPDWAVIDLSQPPDGAAPGRIAAADFFDEHWRLKAPQP
jgi:predicted esterase